LGPPELLALARPVEELHVLAPALAVAAHLHLAAGRTDEAREHLEEFATVTRGVASEYRESLLAPVVRDCVRARALDLARGLVAESVGAVRRDTLHLASARAAIAEADGETAGAGEAYAAAAADWRASGYPFEAFEALRGLARCDPSATGASEEAAAIAERLGIPPADDPTGAPPERGV
jgi:hypothetical protein